MKVLWSSSGIIELFYSALKQATVIFLYLTYHLISFNWYSIMNNWGMYHVQYRYVSEWRSHSLVDMVICIAGLCALWCTWSYNMVVMVTIVTRFFFCVCEVCAVGEETFFIIETVCKSKWHILSETQFIFFSWSYMFQIESIRHQAWWWIDSIWNM
jgi:hypothetical protein